jgi:hypothetical protein
MRKSAVLAGMGLLAIALAAADKPRTFVGEIGDSQCALNIHSLTRSHKEMLKNKKMGGTAKTCTEYCVKYLGGDFVLSVGNDVYRLDDQERVKPFAGRKVKLTGDLDAKTKSIHVLEVAAAE